VGTAHLYARELYLSGRAHLERGGLFAQWLPLHQLGVVDLKAILATFLDVFPHVQLWLAYHRSDTPLALLVGSEEPIRVDADAVRSRLDDPELARSLRSSGFVDATDLAPLYVADEKRLAAAVAGTAIITDDRPSLEFSAPAAYFRQPVLAREALEWLAPLIDPGTAPVDGAPQGSGSAELRSTLLDAQLALLRGDRPAELARYLRGLALSPGARAVRQGLYGVARDRLAAGDPTTARAIADALARAAPSSDEARRAAGLLGRDDDFTDVR
jgi:spermidine synthase